MRLFPRSPLDTPRKYLPCVDFASHTTILSTTSRTGLSQTFLNPLKSEGLEKVQYMFPLYDGVSVVGFKCTVAGRVITGVVEEKQQARKDCKEAIAGGQTAALLEQFTDVADCFTTHVGNVPAGDRVIVEVTYLGGLKQDAETDGVRFTIPTVIARRCGHASADLGELPKNAPFATDEQGIRILVDIAVENGTVIRGVQSPSHPIAMTMGRTSSMPEEASDNQHASATLALGSSELDKDFIIVVMSKGHDTPCTLLETHPTIPNHRALMATLIVVATLEHGPLELEIPVQDIGTGETIHQLAARKAIQELEDRRGWISNAKDTHGKLLKSQLEGRWDEIVEREAVRLGVKYQVGGKWCSFVAVEKNASDSRKNLSDFEMVDGDGSGLPAPKTASSRIYSASILEDVKLGRQAAGSRGASKYKCASSARSSFCAKSPRSPPGASFSRAARSPKKAQYGPQAQSFQQARSAGTFPPQMTCTSYATQDPKMADTPQAKATLQPQNDEERMHQLISLQRFDGSWKWTEGLFTALGEGEEKAKVVLAGFHEAVIATLLAVVFLEDEMALHEGVWEMVVEKARWWLEGRIGRERCADGLSDIKTKILDNA